MNQKPIVEVCIDSADSAQIAQEAGAYRVELCANLAEGGTTPSFGLIKLVRELLTIQLYVLLRPRGGDFYYSNLEFEILKQDLHNCGKAACDGVVIGMLNTNGTIDVDRCGKLIEIAKQYGMGVTFHRAFDRCSNLFEELEKVIGLGCERILTSGGYPTAEEGAPVIKQLIEKAKQRITIMPGSGVTPENATQLAEKTGATELHGTFRTFHTGEMTYQNPKLSDVKHEYGCWKADAKKIKSIISSL